MLNDVINSYNTFIHFINYILKNITNIKTNINKKIDKITTFHYFLKTNSELKKEYESNKFKKEQNILLPVDERKSEELLQLELEIESNIFLTNFIEDTQYFNYEYKNETILIEHRCFAKKLLLESQKNDTNIYKTLNEWSKFISNLKK